ncbi:hypothetical protein QYE76_054449 [Lolium multiflorum]|uniref:Uncharacterized protein n=1 Tax=Lolium multiflorum TaxID=4521 RepID=A0AAD8SYN2_LOLMU|nr:hypothetical protein QYE76_054449 [Lolium multiflorum]
MAGHGEGAANNGFGRRSLHQWEAGLLHMAGYPAPPDFRVPGGWRLSARGVLIPPLLVGGDELDAAIDVVHPQRGVARGGACECFRTTYLRAPNAQDTTRLLEINADRRFPGYKKDATIVLEAVADQETWIWHAFFGMSRSCNDINVLQRSPLMTRLAMREGPLVEFEANDHKYNYGYFLADDIYPRWKTFVKPVIQP